MGRRPGRPALANAGRPTAQEQRPARSRSSRCTVQLGHARGMPSIEDPQFIPQIVFDATRGANQPKARFAYLFPTATRR